jgi:hypothetical protein
MRKIRSSGSVEGVMGNHDPYSDNTEEAHQSDWPLNITDLPSTRMLCGLGSVLDVELRSIHRLDGLCRSRVLPW